MMRLTVWPDLEATRQMNSATQDHGQTRNMRPVKGDIWVFLVAEFNP